MYQKLFIVFFFDVVHQSVQQPPMSPNAENPVEWQNARQCYAKSTFFNAITAQCELCPEGMGPEESELNICHCNSGHITSGKNAQQLDTKIECIPCDQNLAVSANGAYCVKCLASDKSELSPDPETGKCPRCAHWNELAQLDWIQLGKNNSESDQLMVEKCVTCPEGTIPNREENNCEACQSVKCLCEKGNNSSPLCTDLAPSAYSIALIDNQTGFPSAYIKQHLRDAEYGCRGGDRRQCEHLANLCALQDYMRQAGGACAALENARNVLSGQPNPIVPQLFYANIEASVEIFRDNGIDAIFELIDWKRNRRLDILAFVFSMNGTLRGEWSTREGFLQLCSPYRSMTANAFLFGNFYRQNCHLYLDDLYKWKGIWETDGMETLFYELYIRYEDTQGKIMLYPIPILNGDIRGDQYTGLYPNRLDELRRDSRVLLTKRFYTVDMQNNDPTQGNESNLLIRASNRITLHIHIQSSNEGRIFIPYLQISHKQIVQQSPNSLSEIGNSQETTKIDFEFRILYHVGSYPYDKTIEVVMATACSIATVWAALQAYSWGRRSGKMIIDASTILKLVLFAAESIGNVFLFVIAITAVWLTYAYKLQSHLFYVPLNENQEGSFVAYLISATALKALSLAHTLISLLLVQTFFIDWERPRVSREQQPETIKAETGDIRTGKMEKIGRNSAVIWRTYLIANEWNELQLYRKIQLSVQMLLMLFLLEYLQFGNFAKIQSGFGRLDQPPEIIETRMSRFAVDVSFYFIFAMAQWLVQVLVVERMADPFRNFMDLCSVANISVLTMTNPLRGFYIHGRSVHGFADTDMLQMNLFLQRERNNLCALRGLEMGSDLQTFVVNFPRIFRERIDHIMTMEGNSAANFRQQQLGSGGNAENVDRTTLRVQQTAHIYNELNEFLKDFGNRVDPQCEYIITDKRFIEELLGLELADTSKVGTFRRDPSETEYSSAFLYGNEWVLMSFEMLFFCLVDLIWQNRVLAACICYLASKAISRLTKLYFTLQLARSSLVDSRFLI